MRNRINSLIKSKFVKNVAVMVTGAAGAQAVTMALSPIITRLYGPEAFGIVGTFTALTSIIIPIVALSYPIAIVLPKSNENAKKLIKLSLLVSILMALITSIILIFFNHSIASLFNITEISSYLYFIPIVIIFAGLLQVSEQWLIRTNQFKINAKVNFLQSVLINGSKVSVGLIYPVASILVLLQVISHGLRALMMILFARKSTYREKSKKTEKTYTIRELVRKYKDFPIYRTPEVFLHSFSESVPILMLTSLFGPAAAGFYSIGRTVLGLPSSLIGKAIGDVFYPRISEAGNNGENINILIKKTTLTLIVLGIFPFGLVFLFGPILFEFVFGQGWDAAGEYARWIALLSFSAFIITPAIKSMPIINAQRFLLFFTFIKVIISISALLLGFYVFNSDVIAVALFSVSGLVSNVIFILLVLKRSKTYKDIG